MSEKHCTLCSNPIKRRVHKNTKRPFCDAYCYGRWQRNRSFADQGKDRGPRKRCTVRGCSEIHFGRGYCRRHYISLHYRPLHGKPERKKRVVKRKPCDRCGEQFTPKLSTSRFCSMRCYAIWRTKPFIVKKGYRKVLIPDHPRADSKGYVFEHIVVVEAKIGRALSTREEVHHIDFNRQNNAAENLMVCRSHSEHMKLHKPTFARRGPSRNAPHRAS